MINYVPSLELKNRIKNLNAEIRTQFYSSKRTNVSRNLRPGNSKSLWNAVNAAKDIGASSLPQSMKFENNSVPCSSRSDCFAGFFLEKIDSITNAVKADQSVFNGTRKIVADDLMFMNSNEVKKCIEDIKIKNCEGYVS